MSKAQRAYDALLFDEAIKSYVEALEIIEDDSSLPSSITEHISNDILYRIAEAHYAAGRYDETIHTLDGVQEERSLLLQALAYKTSSRPEPAITLLLQLAERNALTEETRWQLAHARYQNDELSTAAADFLQLAEAGVLPRIQWLARLYLARIGLRQEQFDKTQYQLDILDRAIPAENPLRYELSFLNGEAHFFKNDFATAAIHYEKALPKRNSNKAEWNTTSLHRLVRCYLQLADTPGIATDKCSAFLIKADQALQTLETVASDEETFLARGHYWIVRGRRLDDEQSLKEAERLLTQTNLFKSHDALAQALLLRAEAAASHVARDLLYRQLTDIAQSSTEHYTRSWYLRGLNDLNEAEKLVASHNKAGATLLFESAAFSLTRAYELASASNPTLAAHSLKHATKALVEADTDRNTRLCLSLLSNLPTAHPHVLAAAEDPDEFYYLQAWIGTQKPDYFFRNGMVDQSDEHLVWVISTYPTGRFADASLYLLGTRQYRRGEHLAAEETFAHLVNDYPQSPYAGDACYWQARCLERLGAANTTIRQLLMKAFQEYPQATSAPEAYFSYYASSDYLLGNPEALQHLEKMPQLFPESPYTINALLLTGLDHKRTRHSPEGKVLRKRNLNKAIEAFQNAEATFDRLHAQKAITIADIDLFVAVRYRAVLERALANLAIATDSEGAKKHIYLEYAVEMFQKLCLELQDTHHPLASLLVRGECYAPLLEEGSYGLAVAHMQADHDDHATRILDQMLARYQAATITRGYYLSRVYYQKARIAMRGNAPSNAMTFLVQSEEAAKGKVLSSEEKLDLWLQRSECFRKLGQLDNAMLELSRVINDDAISAQRVQAMYLRAEVYELQERPELAQKQLEATAKKGGRWAQIAKEKLDRDYRYD